MKVKIPKEIKIGATKASVSFKNHIRSDDGNNGFFNRRTGELCIDTELKKQSNQRDKVFGHELVEVIKENYCLDIGEAVISNIANGWLEFLWQLGIEFDWEDIDG